MAQSVVNQAVRELTAPTPDTLVGADWGENNSENEAEWGGDEAGGPPPPENALLEQLVVSLANRYHSGAVITAEDATPNPVN